MAQGRDMLGCYVSGSGSRDHNVRWYVTGQISWSESARARSARAGKVRRGVPVRVTTAWRKVPGMWQRAGSAAVRDAGLSQYTSVSSPLRARV